PKKKKKARNSNLIIIDNDAEHGGIKPITNDQAPQVLKSRAKTADPAPLVTTTEPTKKPKSKAKSVPPVVHEAPLVPDAPKQPDDTSAGASEAAPKSKKSKKAPATTPAPEVAPSVTTESVPEISPTDTEIPQPRPKKRGRKAAQDGEPQDPPPPETTKAVEPPAKKQRKSKAETEFEAGGGARSPVTTTIPPPVRTERRSSTILSVPDPDKPATSVGSAADILRRWGNKSVAVEMAASGSGVGPPTTTDVVDQGVETKPKPKRKRKKKDHPADDTSTSISVPAPTTPDAQCLVCTSGLHKPSDCPLLSQRNSETAQVVEGRIQNLEDTQGPARIHQMLIGMLRRWLKDTKKQVEAQNISATPTPVPTVQKSSSPAHSTPIPTRPKKSKLSSVAVSHQSEGSSTEDEDILKSVMESRIESNEEDGEDGEDDEDEEMIDAPRLEPKPEPEPEPQLETTPPSTPTPSPHPASVPLPPSSPTTKALLQSQRMSQSSVRALLDGLESEEAGNGESSSSDEEESDLAESTPSDVARRRHRKTVRLDVQDSDEEAAVRAQAPIQEDEEDSDVEMRDSEERGLVTLSQLLDSSQHIPEEEIVGVVDREGDDDDIEEYDEEVKKNKEAPDVEPGSPIESPDQEPAATESNVDVATQEPGQEGEDEDEGEEDEEDEEESGPVQESELAAPVVKKRGRPPLPQSVKDARAAEKARIQAEKIAQQGGDPLAPRKRGRPRKSQPVEGEGDTSTNGKPASTAPATRTRSHSVGGSQELGPKLRGRPRLSDTVRAEREAEKERVRAEKAIQKLEKKTANANAKATAKGKAANTTPPMADNGENEEGEDEDEDVTVRQSFRAPEETNELPVAPTWSTLKNPSSSRPGSSQADEIEWSEVGENGEGKRPPGSQPSTLKPTPDNRTRKDRAPAKPLFMPSSGLGPRLLPALSPLTSTPAPGKALSLSQQTPSNVLSRRKSMGSVSLPRFADIRKAHELQQRSRKERNKLLSSQPIALGSPQELKPRPNNANEVVTIESSDEEVDSSADEKGKLKPPSQRKRRSAFEYFEQSQSRSKS
ncbi:unnamed protein product, partial [Rhizoctonia solani]